MTISRRNGGLSVVIILKNTFIFDNAMELYCRSCSMLGLKCFDTAISILSGVEPMHMIKKEQLDLRDQSVQNQKEFIHQLFELAP